MPSLLVADDTPIIRTTIAHVVERDLLDFSPVVQASNGAEAVELAQQTRPDIILMDIKMPGLDGLQASAAIRAALPRTKIIILTAYDEFPYVQRALKLGVVDYLLKPIRPAKLVEILTQLQQQIATEQPPAIAESKTYLEETLPVIESSLVDRLVRGSTSDYAAIETSLRHLGKTIAWPAVLVADSPSFEPGGPKASTAALAKLGSSISGEAKTFLIGFSPPRRIIAIVSSDPTRPVVEQMRVLGTAIYETMATRLGLSMTIGLGHHYPGLESIPLSYAEASLACRHSTGQPQQHVVHIDDVEGHYGDRPAYPVKLERKLLESVRLGETSSSIGLLGALLDHLLYSFRERPDIVRNLLSEVIALAARTVIGRGASELDVLRLAHEQVVALLATEDIPDMRAWAANSVTELIAAIPTHPPVAEDIIQQALDYIQQNQHRPDISLNDVAEAVNLSASHLAHLLKERAGVSYKQYLTSLRIESAKRLLRSTNLTISAVGEAVGYQNATNFYRLFQRETGLTPAAYRRSA